MASLYDNTEYPTRMICNDEIQELHPLIDTSGVQCGLWTPSDGDIDPTTLTNCVRHASSSPSCPCLSLSTDVSLLFLFLLIVFYLCVFCITETKITMPLPPLPPSFHIPSQVARLAREAGAQLRLNREVTGVRRLNGGGFVVTSLDNGEEVVEEEADVLVNAAGLWSKQVTAMVDASLVPYHKCFVIEHQYAITEELPGLKALASEGRRVPVLRDLKGSSYIRQERTGLLVGPYEKDCAVRNYDDGRGEWVTGPPLDWGWSLLFLLLWLCTGARARVCVFCWQISHIFVVSSS